MAIVVVSVTLFVFANFLSYVGGESVCPFNPCTFLSLCEGMKCDLDDDCKVICVGSGTPVNEGENVTLATPNNSSCPDDVTCINGVCQNQDESDVVCVCDNGWVGVDCNTTEKTCNLSCPIGERCILFSASGSEMCLPSPDSTTVSPPVTVVQRERNVCNTSFYQQPSRSEHECHLPCIYGVCRNENGTIACVCDPGSHGILCGNKCCLDCGGRGQCYYDNTRQEPVCNCWLNYTGPHCEEIRKIASPAVMSKQSTWYKTVAGVCVAVLVVLLLLLVVLPYIMWRNRVVLVMKIVHYFQDYEDHDERQWDAFVSYKSNTRDEQFVVHTLFPKLEQELGFKLHVHFRDFVPGDTIADNILRAVLGSRRTILIVSPEFASSEWTKFEYQIAQQEMLKRKHRIIPVVLNDISEHKDNIDPNLKAILGSVTYLEWPECESQKKLDKFWKRLELSLPKKRAVSSVPETGKDNPGYDSFRPDAIAIKVDSNKINHPKSVDHEEYATINEAEMNEINLELTNGKNDKNKRDMNIYCQDNKRDTTGILNEQSEKVDDYDCISDKRLNSTQTSSEKYIELLDRGVNTGDI